MLQEKLGELKEQYATSLAQSEAELKRVQTLRDELQKFLQDHREFENWLERSEKELENMYKGGSSPEALPSLLKRQGSFSEDVISHKGDLRFVTISGQKVLDTENSFEGGRGPIHLGGGQGGGRCMVGCRDWNPQSVGMRPRASMGSPEAH